MSERWGDSRMDREALDRHLTDDPRDGYDYDDEGRAWVTLGPGMSQGGLFVFDPVDATLVQAYDPAVIRANCGIGFTADGMPVGLQLVVPQHADVAVLRLLAVLEETLGIDHACTYEP